MRSFRPATAAVVLALSVLLAGTTAPSSYADPGRPDLPANASERAAQALEVVEALKQGVDLDIEPSMALRALFLLRGELRGEDREQADRFLARPDGQSPGYDGDQLWRPGAEARPECNSRICVHYVTSGTHAATYRQARATLANMTRSWNREVGDLGYRAPRRDGSRGNRAGYPATRGKRDVYLVEMSRFYPGAFALAVPENDPAGTSDGNPRTATGYMVLDQDFAEYGCPSPANCRRVTAAHELFHLVQYAYSMMRESDRWFMESTATWMEERVFDGINDNRHYLPYGQLGRPRDPLTKTDGPSRTDVNAPYGNWLLHEFYTQRRGNAVVKRAWYYASRGRGWRSAMAAALNRSGWSWNGMYTAYAANNNLPAVTYPEGRAYRSAAAGPVKKRATSSVSPTLQPHSSASFRFFPGHDGLLDGSTGPRITLDVDLEAGTNHRAYVIVVHDDGTVRRYLIRLDSRGHGVRSFPFRGTDVRHVTLTLVNASPKSAGATYAASN